MHVGAVADQIGRQPLVGERRAREPGLAVMSGAIALKRWVT